MNATYKDSEELLFSCNIVHIQYYSLPCNPCCITSIKMTVWYYNTMIFFLLAGLRDTCFLRDFYRYQDLWLTTLSFRLWISVKRTHKTYLCLPLNIVHASPWHCSLILPVTYCYCAVYLPPDVSYLYWTVFFYYPSIHTSWFLN